MVIKTTEPVLMVMRPYQIYAVKAAKKRVLEVNRMVMYLPAQVQERR